MTHPTKTLAIIYAARNWHIWGPYAATRYCQKRGLDVRLVRIARQLEAVTV